MTACPGRRLNEDRWRISYSPPAWSFFARGRNHVTHRGRTLQRRNRCPACSGREDGQEPRKPDLRKAGRGIPRGGHRPLDGSQQRCWRRQPHLTSNRRPPWSLLTLEPPPVAATGCSLRCPLSGYPFSPGRNPPKIDRSTPAHVQQTLRLIGQD